MWVKLGTLKGRDGLDGLHGRDGLDSINPQPIPGIDGISITDIQQRTKDSFTILLSDKTEKTFQLPKLKGKGVSGGAGQDTYFRSGGGAPAAGLGVLGDHYIDKTNKLLYGPKTGAGWGTGVSLGGTPAGSDTQVQFNDSGAFGASANMVWDNVNKVFELTGSTETFTIGNPTGSITVSDAGASVSGVSPYSGDYVTHLFKIYAYRDVDSTRLYSTTPITGSIYLETGENYRELNFQFAAVANASGYILTWDGGGFGYYPYSKDIGNSVNYDDDGQVSYTYSGVDYTPPNGNSVTFNLAPIWVGKTLDLATKNAEILKFGTEENVFKWDAVNQRLKLSTSADALSTLNANIVASTLTAASATITSLAGTHSTGTVASAVDVLAAASGSLDSFRDVLIGLAVTGGNAMRTASNNTLKLNPSRRVVTINTGAVELGQGTSGTMLSIEARSEYAAVAMKATGTAGVHFFQIIDPSNVVRSVYRADGVAIFGSINYANYGRALFIDDGFAGSPFSGQLSSLAYYSQDDQSIYGWAVGNRTYDTGWQKANVVCVALNAGGGYMGTPDATPLSFRTNNVDRISISSTGAATFSVAPVISTATASTIAGFDASKNLITLSTATYPSLTELAYVKGVTSAIQTQLNGKQASGTYVTGATNSSLTLTSTTLGINLANANSWTDTQTISKSQTITLSAPASLAASLVDIGSGGFAGDGSDVTLHVYAYKTVGIYTTYSSVASVNCGNEGGFNFNVAASWNAVTGADGYKVIISGNSGYFYYYTTPLTSLTLDGSQTDSNATVTPTSPQTVKDTALVLNGVAPLADAEFNGKLRLYDGTTQAVVIGDVTGNTRGLRAIDIATKRTGATYVGSGTDSLLIGDGISSGLESVSIARGLASAYRSLAMMNGTASGDSSLAIIGTATGQSAVALGTSSSATASYALALLGTASGSASVAIGQQSTASGAGAFALAFFSQASGIRTIALGAGVQSSGDYTSAIGAYFTDNTPNAIVFGTGRSATVGGNFTLQKLTDDRIDFSRDIYVNSATAGNGITNGTFASTASWTRGTGITITSGQARFAAVTTGKLTQAAATLPIPIIAGEEYEFTYDVASYSSGNVRAVLGGVNLTARNANGTYTETFTAITGGTDVFFECTSTPATLRIDNVTNYRKVKGNITAAGNVKMTTAGSGLYVKENTNATMGLATLVAGVAVVSTTKVTANSRIFLTRQTIAGTLGTSVDVTARTAGTSFTITSNGSILDTSTVSWIIIEPA